MKILRNTWGQQSDDQRSIVTLTAELQTIKDSNIQLSASVLRNIQKKKPSDSSGPKKYNPNELKHVWRSVRRECSSATLNKFNNTYNWCNYHKKWVTDTNEECKGQNRTNRQPSNNTPQATTPRPPAASVTPTPVSYAATFDAIMAAICEEQDPPL